MANPYQDPNKQFYGQQTPPVSLPMPPGVSQGHVGGGLQHRNPMPPAAPFGGYSGNTCGFAPVAPGATGAFSSPQYSGAGGAPWAPPPPAAASDRTPPTSQQSSAAAMQIGHGFQRPGEKRDQFQERVGPQPAFMNNLSAGEQLAASFLMNQWQAHGQQYTAGAQTLFMSLKFYFTVDNSYVRKKLMILLMPFRNQSWRRIRNDDADPSGEARTAKYMPPIRDVNCPDLYLPLMGFITYVLLVGYAKGATGQFSPEVIVEVATACLVTQILEVLLIRLALYLIQAHLGLLDLVAYTGYKYLSLTINMFLGLQLGNFVYYISLLYTGSMIALSMLKQMKAAVDASGTGIGGKRKTYTIAGVAFAQVLFIWFLGYNGILSQFASSS